jgi:hypothetical protein
VHVHIAACNEWQLESAALCIEFFELPALLTIGKQLDGDPQAIAKCFTYPVVLYIEGQSIVRDPEHNAVSQAIFERKAR